MGETNFTLGSNSKFDFLFFDTGLLLPRIQAPQATFKAVLMAVNMTKELQTKCNTCFGSPRMILQSIWSLDIGKTLFPKNTLADTPPTPPPWVWQITIHFHFFFFSTLDIKTGLVWFILILYTDAFILILDCQFRLDNVSRWICSNRNKLMSSSGEIKDLVWLLKTCVSCLIIKYVQSNETPKKACFNCFWSFEFPLSLQSRKIFAVFLPITWGPTCLDRDQFDEALRVGAATQQRQVDFSFLYFGKWFLCQFPLKTWNILHGAFLTP